MTNIVISEPWELLVGWQDDVCEPVIKYPMAPREALAILEEAGQMFNVGIRLDQIIAGMRWARTHTT